MFQEQTDVTYNMSHLSVLKYDISIYHDMESNKFELKCFICLFRTPIVALLADQSTVICWHPEPQFPYEHTKVCFPD